MDAIDDLDVIVVGAGPTGLALALQAASCGARVAVLDARDGTPRPSHALLLHPRTLELLRTLGVTDELAARGRQGLRAVVHAGRHRVPVDLGHLPLLDTAFPHLLLVSQAQVEQVFLSRLTGLGVAVVWDTAVDRVCTAEGMVQVEAQGSGPTWQARFVVGCDGAESTVRRQAGISFPGRRYLHSVVVADVEVDGLEPGVAAAHVFVSGGGLLFLFALGERATWRLVVAGPQARSSAGEPPDDTHWLHRVVADHTGDAVRLASVAWAEHVPLRHHLASSYRRANVFLAGDAAHVHSPAGAQGMNTGIQDACNLGWKLALAAHGWAGAAELLDGYERERRPVARLGTAWTSLAWWAESATGPVARFARQLLVPHVAPIALGHLRALGPVLRLVTGLAQSYRPRSLAALPLGGTRRVGEGDRLPDVGLGDDAPAARLHDLLAVPAYHLIVLGYPTEPAPPSLLPPGWVRVVRLDGAAAQRVAARLRVASPARCLVRPDGHVQRLATVSHVTS